MRLRVLAPEQIERSLIYAYVLMSNRIGGFETKRGAFHAVRRPCVTVTQLVRVGAQYNLAEMTGIYFTLLRRSAIRVCQPGPVAFQRAMTFAGRRREMSFLGLSERGRPPFLTLALESISSVSSGSS